MENIEFMVVRTDIRIPRPKDPQDINKILYAVSGHADTIIETEFSSLLRVGLLGCSVGVVDETGKNIELPLPV